MPERDYIPVQEVKQFLKREQFRNKATRNALGMAKADPARALRQHNAEDTLAGIDFIERHAASARDLNFPRALVDELKATLPEMDAPAERDAVPLKATTDSVERVAGVLDRMQAAVSDEAGIEAMKESANRASTAFREHRQYSEKKRADAARQRGGRRRW